MAGTGRFYDRTIRDWEDRVREHLIEAVAAAWAKFGSVEVRLFYGPSKDPELAADGATRRKYETTFHVDPSNVAKLDGNVRLQVPGEFSGEEFSFELSVFEAVKRAREQYCAGPGELMTEWVRALDGVERVVSACMKEDAAPHPRGEGIAFSR